jgi:TonB family protein
MRPVALLAVVAGAAALLTASGARDALSAQVVAGVAVEETSRLPVAGLRLRLLYYPPGTADAVTVDSGRTDARGLFQLIAPRPGAYQLEFRSLREPLARGPVDTLGAEAVSEHAYPVPISRRGVERPYELEEVDKPVAPILTAGTGPLYPPELKKAKVSGAVIASFVVDTAGAVEADSFRVVSATHAGFVASVREGVLRMHFTPAEIAGVRVRQRVQSPFQFQM